MMMMDDGKKDAASASISQAAPIIEATPVPIALPVDDLAASAANPVTVVITAAKAVAEPAPALVAPAPTVAAAAAPVADAKEAPTVIVSATPDAAHVDLTPAAIVEPTDLDVADKKKCKRATPCPKADAVVRDAVALEAVNKTKLKQQQQQDEAVAKIDEQEETMRMVLGGDEEDDVDGEDDYDDGDEDMFDGADEDGGLVAAATAAAAAAPSAAAAAARQKKAPKKAAEPAKPKSKAKAKPKPKKGAAAVDEHKKSGSSSGSRKRSAPSDEGASKPKKRAKRALTEAEQAESNRRQPGCAMIKAEYDRIVRALDALVRKRVQREESNGGQAPTSVCSILINNLVDFYEQDVLIPFERKFARYMN